MISLDAARNSLRGTDKTLILNESSPLASLFYGQADRAEPAPVPSAGE